MTRKLTLTSVLLALFLTGCMMPGLFKEEPPFDVSALSTRELEKVTHELDCDKDDLVFKFYDYGGSDYERKVDLYEAATGLLEKTLICYHELHRRHLVLDDVYYKKYFVDENGENKQPPNFARLARETYISLAKIMLLDPRYHDLLQPSR